MCPVQEHSLTPVDWLANLRHFCRGWLAFPYLTPRIMGWMGDNVKRLLFHRCCYCCWCCWMPFTCAVHAWEVSIYLVQRAKHTRIGRESIWINYAQNYVACIFAQTNRCHCLPTKQRQQVINDPNCIRGHKSQHLNNNRNIIARQRGTPPALRVFAKFNLWGAFCRRWGDSYFNLIKIQYSWLCSSSQ